MNELASDLLKALSPQRYVESLNIIPWKWQEVVLDPSIRRMILLCARQSGKSTIVGAKALQKAKYYPGSLILIVSDSQDHAKEMMKKIKVMLSAEPIALELTIDSGFEVELANKSRILALPGTEKAVRSYSAPAMIIVDEAARVEDNTYIAVRGTMAGHEAETELVLLSTPQGKHGFFYEAWEKVGRWQRFLVIPPFELVDGELIKASSLRIMREKWQRTGVTVFYSQYHTLEGLQEQLEALGDPMFRQEFLCSFEDEPGTMFSAELIDSMLVDSDEPSPFDKLLVDGTDPFEE